jgi:cytochrome c biogenesis protein CcmG, thiol:disulfide interchange protein DsbE
MNRSIIDNGSAADEQSTVRRVKRWRFITIAGVLVFVALLAWGIVHAAQEQRKGGHAPDFTLTLYGGDEITLAELRGQIVVINFWASWCEPCREEASYLERVWQQRQSDGIMFIGIDYLDSEKEALAYLDQYGVTYPNGPDLASTIAQKYRIRGVPETFIINKQGQIVYFKSGPVTEDELLAELAKFEQ